MTRKVWCDDWACPASVSCAHHFGRSAAYAAMRPGSKVESIENTGKYERDLQNCASYRFDRAKPWLMPLPGQITVPLGPIFGSYRA
jgi:hypothetical protein